jgi:hypothetical protein
LTPPIEIAEPHVRMVSSLRAYAQELRLAAVLAGDSVEFAATMARADAHAKAWTGAFVEIKARGYARVAVG